MCETLTTWIFRKTTAGQAAAQSATSRQEYRAAEASAWRGLSSLVTIWHWKPKNLRRLQNHRYRAPYRKRNNQPLVAAVRPLPQQSNPRPPWE